MSETRVMRFQTFHNLDHFPSFCLIFSKIQFVLSSVSDVQISSVLPFFHTKFNCPSIWTGFKHVKPDPVKIRIFRIFKTGFLPGTAISDFFLYSPTSPMVWEFQNCKAIWINCQFVHLGTGPVWEEDKCHPFFCSQYLLHDSSSRWDWADSQSAAAILSLEAKANALCM